MRDSEGHEDVCICPSPYPAMSCLRSLGMPWNAQTALLGAVRANRPIAVNPGDVRSLRPYCDHAAQGGSTWKHVEFFDVP